jgi:hypothetical protein
MSSGRSKSSARAGSTAAATTKTGKKTKDARFLEMGERVSQLEQKRKERRSQVCSFFYDAARKFVLDPKKHKAFFEYVAVGTTALLDADALDEIRGFADIDDSLPIRARYIGRALRELGAVSDKSFKNRIEIFAFFYDSPQVAAVGESTKVDYRDCAIECYEFLNGLLGTKPRVHGNSVSEALEKPLKRLNQLRLSDNVTRPVSSAASITHKKSEGSYLKPLGVDVFDGWPEWPTALGRP